MEHRHYRAKTLIILFLLGTLTFGLVYYLWNFEYRVEVPLPAAGPKSVVIPLLRVESGGSPRATIALFSFLNDSPSGKLRVLDTQSLLPLYEIKLELLNDKGSFVEVSKTQNYFKEVSAAETRVKGAQYNPKSDIQIDLLPKSSYTRPPIPISDLFQIAREGRYKLTISYDPKRVLTASELDHYSIFNQTRTTMIVFDYQMSDSPKSTALNSSQMPESLRPLLPPSAFEKPESPYNKKSEPRQKQ